MWNTILFDLDGTLTDSAEGITKSVQYALDHLGIREEDLKKLECFVGPPLKEQFMKHYGFTNAQAAEAVVLYRERYASIGIMENRPYQGIKEMLQSLKERGYVLGVASSKPTYFVKKILDYFELTSYFNVVIGSEMDGRRTDKWEVIEEALSQLDLGLGREQVLMVGDREHDILGARKAGVTCVGVSYGYGGTSELKKAGAQKIAGSVQELRSYLLEGDRGNISEIKERNPRSKENLPWKIFRVAYPIGIHFGSSLVVSFLLGIMITILYMINPGFFSGSMEDTIMRYSLWMVGVGNLIAVPFLIWCFIRDKRETFGRLSGKTVKSILFAIFFTVACSQIIGAIMLLLRLDVLFPSYSQSMNEMLYNQSLWGQLLVLGVLAPIAEELTFRGLVFKRLEDYMDVKWAVLLSGFLFGAYHGNIFQFIYAFVLGIVLALLYHYSKSIWVPIAGHAATNIYSVIQSELMSGVPEVFYLLFLLICVVIVVVGIWYLRRTSRENN